MINQNVSPQMAVDFLNELLSIDRDAVHKLCLDRVVCNEQLGDHPTVQVHKAKDGICSVGLIGILNGLFGSFDDGDLKGWGCIAADVADNIEPYKIRFFYVLKNEKEKSK